MTGTSKKRTALLAVAGASAASGGCADTGASDGSADRVGPAAPARTNNAPTTSATGRAQLQVGRPPVRLATTPGLKLGPARQADAVRAAQDFAVSLTRWLYGDRKRLDVEPLAAAVRRELGSSPPYIPADQRGTGEGRVQLLELAQQTELSGVVTVTINDLRAGYRISAALELRGGHWQIVHLNTH
jgi:hypothetical protein